MLLPGRCSVGTVGSSTSFLFSIRCKNSYIPGYQIVAHYRLQSIGVLRTWRANAACSRQVYQVSALDRDLLTKNIGLCFRFSSSLNNAALTEIFETAK